MIIGAISTKLLGKSIIMAAARCCVRADSESQLPQLSASLSPFKLQFKFKLKFTVRVAKCCQWHSLAAPRVQN